MKIEIDKKKIPYEFKFRSKDRLFTIAVKHSYWQDRIYLDLLDEERNAILLGEKLVYGRPLAFHLLEDKNSNSNIDLPQAFIVPLSIDNKVRIVNLKNLSETVFLEYVER